MGSHGTNVSLRLGAAIVVMVIGVTLIAPFLYPHSATEQHLALGNQPPSPSHWFGTDPLGRDLFARTLSGARVSLAIATVAVVINLVVGVPVGFLAGWYGGWVDFLVMAVVDILYGIPLLLFVVFFLVILGPGIRGLLLALGLVYWLDVARQVRGQVLVLKEADFVTAARALGASPGHIFRWHLLPNMVGPLLVTITVQIPQAIFFEAFLGFLGLGVTPPAASWGTLLAQGMTNFRSNPWQVFFPALLLGVTIWGFTLLGDGLAKERLN